MPNHESTHMMKMIARRHPKLRWQVKITHGGHNKDAEFWQTLPANKHPRWNSGHEYRPMPKDWVVQHWYRDAPSQKRYTQSVVPQEVTQSVVPQEAMQHAGTAINRLVVENKQLNAAAQLRAIVDTLYWDAVIDSEPRDKALSYIDMDMSKRDVQETIAKIKKEVNG